MSDSLVKALVNIVWQPDTEADGQRFFVSEMDE